MIKLLPLLKLLVVAATCLLLIDVIVFRSGWYSGWIQPNSTAGSVVASMLQVDRYREPQLKNVLILGNSKMGEGFSGPLANRAVARPDLHFVNGAVAGTSPRIWDYLLREQDPNTNRYAAIVLMVDYDLAALEQDLGNYSLDTSYLRPLLRLRDLQSYPSSFSDPEQQTRARRAILLPMQALHDDLVSLLRAPWKRYKEIVTNRPIWLKAVIDYPGRDQVLPNLNIDADTGMPMDWSPLEASRKAELDGYFKGLRRVATLERQAENERYFRTWLGAIAKRYKAAGIPVIVFSAPRGPWHQQLGNPPQPNHVIQSLVNEDALLALPGDAFISLEQPLYFFDSLHMNRAGRERFSQLLAAQIAPLIH